MNKQIDTEMIEKEFAEKKLKGSVYLSKDEDGEVSQVTFHVKPTRRKNGHEIVGEIIGRAAKEYNLYYATGLTLGHDWQYAYIPHNKPNPFFMFSKDYKEGME